MPILDGFQTIEKLMKMQREGFINLSNTKIIAVSALTTKQFHESKNSELFHSFMEKPV